MIKVKFYCTMTKICARIGMRSTAHKMFDMACDEAMKMLTRIEKG